MQTAGSPVLAYAGVRWRTLEYAGVRWSTLAYAGIRWRTLANVSVIVASPPLASAGVRWHPLALRVCLFYITNQGHLQLPAPR